MELRASGAQHVGDTGRGVEPWWMEAVVFDGPFHPIRIAMSHDDVLVTPARVADRNRAPVGETLDGKIRDRA